MDRHTRWSLFVQLKFIFMLNAVVGCSHHQQREDNEPVLNSDSILPSNATVSATLTLPHKNIPTIWTNPT